MSEFKSSLNELSNYCKEKVKKNIGKQFYELCLNEDDDINEMNMFIVTTNMFYKEILLCARDYCGRNDKDLLHDVYEKNNMNILNYLLGLEFKQELFINNILFHVVKDGNVDLLKKILKKSVYCFGAMDYDLYYACRNVLKKNKNEEIKKMINKYFNYITQ